MLPSKICKDFAVVLFLLFVTFHTAFCGVVEARNLAIKLHKKNKQPDVEVQDVIRRASKDSDVLVPAHKTAEEFFASLDGLQSKGLSNLKIKMEKRVKLAQEKVNVSKRLSPREKDFKLHVLEMFLEELRESEKDMLTAEDALRKSLKVDFWNSSTLKENSRKRLEALRLATLKEESSFNRMHEFEIKMKKYAHEMNSTSWMGELIKEISHAADQLEENMAEHVLSDKGMQQVDGAHIKAVLHVKERIGESLEEIKQHQSEDNGMVDDDRLDVLIDTENNKYILTRLHDTTSPFIDHILVMDVIMVFLLAIPLGYLCQLVGLPTLFGYILAGLILGPSGMNMIQEMIQVETLGELGVYMIMFCTGIEFSFEKIHKLWRTAVQGPCLISIIMVVFGVIIGNVIDAPRSECAFVAACLSLSSTPLVTKFLQGTSKADMGGSDYSNILVAMLVVQDIQLSCIVALLPGFASDQATGKRFSEVFSYFAAVIMKTLSSLLLIGLVVIVCVRFVMPLCARYIAQQTREMQILGALALMYTCQALTHLIGVSRELGCFAAGVMISSSTSLLPGLEEKVFAIHDFLSVLFFASIGFHVFPSFVFVELTLLVSLTAFVVAGKYTISLFVLHFVLPSPSRKLKWLVSSALAQVSEFSFVLGSRAKYLKIITREVYLLILSVTTLSLLLAPALWKLSLWRYRIRHLAEHIS